MILVSTLFGVLLNLTVFGYSSSIAPVDEIKDK
jgi:hypothetical protein